MKEERQCWWIFFHKWEMWKRCGDADARRCIKCGRLQVRWIY